MERRLSLSRLTLNLAYYFCSATPFAFAKGVIGAFDKVSFILKFQPSIPSHIQTTFTSSSLPLTILNNAKMLVFTEYNNRQKRINPNIFVKYWYFPDRALYKPAILHSQKSQPIKMTNYFVEQYMFHRFNIKQLSEYHDCDRCNHQFRLFA